MWSTPTARGLGLVVLYVSWGSTYPVMKVALRTIPPFLLLTARCLLAALALLLIARLLGASWPGRRQWLGSLVVGGLVLGGGHGLTAWAMVQASGGLAALLVSVVSVWLAVLSWILLGRRPSRRTGLGLLTGLAGVAVLAGTASAGLGWAPLLALIVSPLAWALGSVVSSRVRLPAEPLMATAAQLLVLVPVFALLAVAAGEPARITAASLSGTSLTALIYLALVGYVIGFAAYTWLIRELALATVGTYAYANPLVAVGLGVLLLGEPLTGSMLLGGLVILGGVALVVWDRAPLAPATVLTVPVPVVDVPPPPRVRDVAVASEA